MGENHPREVLFGARLAAGTLDTLPHLDAAPPTRWPVPGPKPSSRPGLQT